MLGQYNFSLSFLFVLRDGTSPWGAGFFLSRACRLFLLLPPINRTARGERKEKGLGLLHSPCVSLSITFTCSLSPCLSISHMSLTVVLPLCCNSLMPHHLFLPIHPIHQNLQEAVGLQKRSHLDTVPLSLESFLIGSRGLLLTLQLLGAKKKTKEGRRGGRQRRSSSFFFPLSCSSRADWHLSSVFLSICAPMLVTIHDDDVEKREGDKRQPEKRKTVTMASLARYNSEKGSPFFFFIRR